MKKGILLAVVGFVASMMTTGMSFAAADCADMAIVGTGTTPYTDSGLFVKVKATNAAGQACGAGADIQYFLDTTNTDATYATILTALSLGKTIFIQVSAPAANSLLLVTAVKN